MVEGGSVVSGGKFSVGECAVEAGAMRERASSHVHQAEHDSPGVAVISESILSRIATSISSLHHMVCFPGVSQGVVSSFRNCLHTNTTPRSSYLESPGRYSLR